MSELPLFMSCREAKFPETRLSPTRNLKNLVGFACTYKHLLE
jgi:hypothetical protein